MKKILIVLFVFLTSFNVCLADNGGYEQLPVCKPIPAQSKDLYRQNIEQLLTKEVPQTKKELDTIVSNVYQLKTKLLKKKNIRPNDKDYIKLFTISSYECFIKPFNTLYSHIIAVTNKYLDTPITDDEYTEHYVWCYMNDNDIGMSWNNDLSWYLQEKINIMDKYIAEVESRMDYKLTKQYKIEIDKTIKNEIPLALNEVDRIYNEALQIYKTGLTAKKKRDKYICKLQSYEDYIYNPEFYFYVKLVDVTRKYAYIDNSKTSTDFSGTLYDILYPYLKANNIELSKMDILTNHTETRKKEISEFIYSLQK